MPFPNTDYPGTIDVAVARTDGVDIVHDVDFNYQDEQARTLQSFLGASGQLIGENLAGMGLGGMLSPIPTGAPSIAIKLVARDHYVAGKVLSVGEDYDAAPPAYTELLYLDHTGLLWTEGGADFSNAAASLRIPVYAALPAAGTVGRVAYQSGVPAGFYVDSGAAWVGPLASSAVWTEQNVLHVAKHGNDANTGTAIYDAKLTITGAIAALAGPFTTIVVHPGLYLEPATLVIPLVTSIVGIDRRTTFVTVAGAPIFSIATGATRLIRELTLFPSVPGAALGTVDAAEAHFERCLLQGVITFTGASARLHLEDETELAGMIDIAGGNPAAMVVLRGARVAGDAVNGYALRYGDADPVVIIEKGSYVQGAAGFAAIHWNNVTNNDLRIKHSTVRHGTGGAANNPFARTGAVTPSFRSGHNVFNSDPEIGGIWHNIIAAPQRYDAFDAGYDY